VQVASFGLAARKRSRIVTIADALADRYPDLSDPEQAIAAGRVLVDGKPVLNPRARVAVSTSIVVESEAELRGSTKLEAALDGFSVDVGGRVALDLGAAAGGFATVLLERGAARVYAVDAGHGQLRGALRQDSRVVNLERTNLGDLTTEHVPEAVEVVTVDLSYLSITRALPQLARIAITPGADLVALVKPMFELGLDRPPLSNDETLQAAVDAARHGVETAGWQLLGDMESPIRGARGAVEFFVHARR
jgi:23S rRNA (cytidine1920-2'-O)/16S rRNA (cytidine1409-2'-O)-methyltransferase